MSAVIDRFNDWLASERGFRHAVTAVAIWTLAVFSGFDAHGFWFLYTVSAASFLALFAVANIGQHASHKVDEALEQIDTVVDQVLATTRTLIRLAENETSIQDALVAQSEAIRAAVEELRSSR